jgi:hypothetical protein
LTFLLDVNVLIALLDPAHISHDAAREWFKSAGHANWATCPTTENGVIRIVGPFELPKHARFAGCRSAVIAQTLQPSRPRILAGRPKLSQRQRRRSLQNPDFAAGDGQLPFGAGRLARRPARHFRPQAFAQSGPRWKEGALRDRLNARSITPPRTAPPRPCRRRRTSSPPHSARRAACPRSAHGQLDARRSCRKGGRPR